MNHLVPATRLLGLAALIALGAGYLIRSFGLKYGIVSASDETRHGPGGIPLLGGVGVLLALAAGIVWSFPGWPVALWLALLLAGLGVMGGWDDLRGTSPRLRLATEGFLALLWIALAFLPAVRAGVPALGATLGGALLLAFLVVAGANAFNLCDNADGLATGCGMISFLGLYVLGVRGGVAPGFPAFLALTACGALLGFLYWNRPPARLYLGDCGALPLGGLLALLLAGHLRGGLPIVAVAAMAGYFLFDPLYVVIGRLLSRRSPLTGGTDHPSHDLRRRMRSWALAWTVILLVHGLSVAVGVAVLRDEARANHLGWVLLFWVGLLALALCGRGTTRAGRPPHGEIRERA